MRIFSQDECIGLKVKSTVDAQKLDRCRKCHAPHPMARKPFPLDCTSCPDCGFPSVTPGEPVTSDAIMPGMQMRVANMLLAIGRALFNVARRI